VETFEGKTYATEVQNIQVADGDVIRDMEIPLYMMFPKIYSCPTVIHPKFQVRIDPKSKCALDRIPDKYHRNLC